MALGCEGYSPGVLKKIEYAGGNGRSFESAAESLERLAECSISARQVERLTEKLGKQRGGLRDQDVEAMKARTLRSPYKQAPAIAVVMVDAGKAQFREEDAGPGVHGAHWGDVKAACLQTYSDVEFKRDPQPDPPEVFLDPDRVERLCREMEKVRGTSTKDETRKLPEQKKKKTKKKRKKRHQRPARLVRTVVATTAAVEPFGWMVSAEALKRKMYAAKKRAFIGDGGNWIEPLGQMHFAGWTQILDFLHLLVHLFAAARLLFANNPACAWKLYEQMLRDAWAGRVQKVIDALRLQLDRLGSEPSIGKGARHVVELALDYVVRNRERMDYACYRQQGLPISSSLMESLIKQLNHRVKGTEQFWNDGGLEAVLQVRAAYLSQDERVDAFYENRPRSPAVGRHRLKPFQPTG